MQNSHLEHTGFATKVIHGRGNHEKKNSPLTTPIYQSATFSFESAEQGARIFAGEESGYFYSRMGNPTNASLEETLALLEGSEAALVTASGMGAISASLWTILQAGDHIVCSQTVYGCTLDLLQHGLSKFGVDTTFVDMRNPQNVTDAIQPNTKVVFVETPANPNLVLNDIQAIADTAHEKVKNCLVIVDNTFATPYLQQPLKLGADLVVHSATKYLNGHGDVIAGVVAGKKDLLHRIRMEGVKDLTGSVQSPFNSYLLIRGLKTLQIRMERHCDNAEAVARFLSTHPAVEKLYYPGLDSFPQKELVRRQMKRPGAIMAMEVKGGFEAGKKMINALKLCKIAVSLGDAETLIQHPASMTHLPYTPEERARAGISDGLIRISVGLEDPQDIIADLKHTLDALSA